jgi:hypothetical protein
LGGVRWGRDGEGEREEEDEVFHGGREKAETLGNPITFRLLGCWHSVLIDHRGVLRWAQWGFLPIVE